MTPSLLQTAIDGLLYQASHNAEKVALIADGQSYSYADLHRQSSQLANYLQKQGLQKGDRLAIYLENSYATAVAIYAALKLGAIFLVINHQIKSQKLMSIVQDADTAWLISQSGLRAQFLPLLDKGIIQNLLLDKADGQLSFNSLENIFTQVSTDYVQPLVIADDLAALIYTSGTTGDPKGVMHTQSSMLFAIASISEYLQINQTDKILSVLPLAFSYGLYQLLISVWQGACLILEKGFNYPAQVFNLIQQESVSIFPAIPTIYSLIIAAHKRSPLSFPSVNKITNAGAALPPAFIEPLQTIFPNADLYAMYGQTECNRACYLPPQYLRGDKLNHYSTSVGIAIPGTENFLVDEAGNKLTPGNQGFLCVRGPHLMCGYWKKPQLTAEALRKDPVTSSSFLYTGDWFYMDEQGFLFFRGRSDEIIKSRGEKVSPTEIEHALTAIDGVDEAAVLAQDDENLGQAIIAFVTISQSDLPDRKIKKLLMDKVEAYMVPKDIIILNELPKTANGKIDKRQLRESLLNHKPVTG